QVSHVVAGHLTYCSVYTVYEWHQVPPISADLCKSRELPTKPFPISPNQGVTPMKRNLLSASVAFAVGIGSIGIVPLAKAAAGDSTTFFMVKSAGAVPCLDAAASGRVTISDLGPVQNM